MPLWRIAATVPNEATAEAVADYLGTLTDAVTAFETERQGPWLVQGFATEKPARAPIEAAMALLAASLGVAAPSVEIEKLDEIDWLKRNQESFPPFRIGRFYIHGSHVDRVPAGGAIPLRIDAATAFGTGEHATTHGCLLALDRLARRGRRRHVLDMGCGTAILAIAAAKLWRRPVVASDIDARSACVAVENATVNGVGPLVRVTAAPGYRCDAVRAGRPYDLVFANILARPLMAMAGDLAAHLAPGGIAILSGLLASQERAVARAYRARGLRLLGRIPLAGWHTLILRKPW